MSASVAEPVPELSERTRENIKRATWAGGIGNLVEQFDYGVYGVMAPVLAPVFFPSANPVLAVLSTYAVIAIACVFRPLGGTLIGLWGDKAGRKKTLLWTIIAMGVITAAVGVLPTYRQVGYLAPVLLLVLRIVQGMVAGGEYAGAVAFIVEWAPPRRRAYFTSFVSISVFIGILAGAGLAAATNAVFTSAELAAGAWRIPFLLVLPLSAVGWYLRRRVEETPEFMRETRGGTEVVKTPLREALRSQWKPMLVFCGSSITLAILSYTWVTYFPQYLSGTLHLPRAVGLASNAISVAVLIPLLPLAGKLSDRIGRRPMLIAGCLGCIFIVPLAFKVAEAGTFAAAVAGQLIYLVPEFCMTGIVTVCISELFATRTRFSASAVAYNSSFSIFAGITPFVAALLVERFGTIYAVWGYLAAAAVVSLVVIVFFMKETAHTKLSDDKYAR